jgi:hypothetical protein
MYDHSRMSIIGRIKFGERRAPSFSLGPEYRNYRLREQAADALSLSHSRAHLHSQSTPEHRALQRNTHF